MKQFNVFWYRRDLRIRDNAGLYHALKAGLPVRPIFIFDNNILSKLSSRSDARVTFLHKTITALKKQFNDLGSDLWVFKGDPCEIWNDLCKNHQIKAVYLNHDYESYALQRDESVRKLLATHGISFHTFKDHVIFEKEEVVKDDGKPYTVFTPYKKRWLSKLTEKGTADTSFYFKAYPSEEKISHFIKDDQYMEMISLSDMGFSASTIPIPPVEIKQSIIREYDQKRDYPSIEGTSRLGIHFRFGTISIREKARKAAILNQTYLSELIWRDFYAMILTHFPHVEKNAFRPEYDHIQWRNDENDFAAWCEGKTGYPIVDAGMRELKSTGHMHNRVRMITASFLTKHLLIDWRWGEAWFASHLLDFDLASNNGGWQWAAGCGTDAAPYFRIFSPDAQTDRFDKDKKYIKKWVPEYGTHRYVKPIIDHKFARERCLKVYKEGLSK